MEKMKQGDARPAYGLEKEAVREEIQTGLQTGVEILAGNVEKGKETDHFHNTKYLLKQYRRVEYSIRISEADLNLRMEMQHGMRLSTLKVNLDVAVQYCTRVDQARIDREVSEAESRLLDKPCSYHLMEGRIIKHDGDFFFLKKRCRKNGYRLSGYELLRIAWGMGIETARKAVPYA